jgi:hypothetical protein
MFSKPSKTLAEAGANLFRRACWLGWIADWQTLGPCRALGPLQIAVRLAPAIFEDDISESNTADWPEPSHRIADRQQSIRVKTGRQAQSRFRFLLELQVQRRQRRAEAERSRREEHVLNRRVDGRTGCAGRCPAFKARDDPNGSLMDVVGQMFRRIEQPQKSLAAGARGRFTSPVPWGDLLVPRTLVQGPDRLLDLRIADYLKPPTLACSAISFLPVAIGEIEFIPPLATVSGDRASALEHAFPEFAIPSARNIEFRLAVPCCFEAGKRINFVRALMKPRQNPRHLPGRGSRNLQQKDPYSVRHNNTHRTC